MSLCVGSPLASLKVYQHEVGSLVSNPKLRFGKASVTLVLNVKATLASQTRFLFF